MMKYSIIRWWLCWWWPKLMAGSILYSVFDPCVKLFQYLFVRILLTLHTHTMTLTMTHYRPVLTFPSDHLDLIGVLLFQLWHVLFDIIIRWRETTTTIKLPVFDGIDDDDQKALLMSIVAIPWWYYSFYLILMAIVDPILMTYYLVFW